nr:MAG TPA: baseplate protein [Caudoviricetes sp.]
MLQTEYEFTLPKGYVDRDGNLHKNGRMRLATAMDEIGPARDPRVMRNPDYLMIILLSRVIVKLGSLSEITTNTIESLFVSDLTFLQNMYETINKAEAPMVQATCPYCGREFTTELNFKG